MEVGDGSSDIWPRPPRRYEGRRLYRVEVAVLRHDELVPDVRDFNVASSLGEHKAVAMACRAIERLNATSDRERWHGVWDVRVTDRGEIDRIDATTLLDPFED